MGLRATLGYGFNPSAVEGSGEVLATQEAAGEAWTSASGPTGSFEWDTLDLTDRCSVAGSAATLSTLPNLPSVVSALAARWGLGSLGGSLSRRFAGPRQSGLA